MLKNIVFLLRSIETQTFAIKELLERIDIRLARLTETSSPQQPSIESAIDTLRIFCLNRIDCRGCTLEKWCDYIRKVHGAFLPEDWPPLGEVKHD